MFAKEDEAFQRSGSVHVRVRRLGAAILVAATGASTLKAACKRVQGAGVWMYNVLFLVIWCALLCFTMPVSCSVGFVVRAKSRCDRQIQSSKGDGTARRSDKMLT